MILKIAPLTMIKLGNTASPLARKILLHIMAMPVKMNHIHILAIGVQ